MGKERVGFLNDGDACAGSGQEPGQGGPSDAGSTDEDAHGKLQCDREGEEKVGLWRDGDDECSGVEGGLPLLNR